MSFFDSQNPGIGGLDELTTAEGLLVQNLASLTYAQGDILYYNGTNLINLGAGTSGWFLKTQGAGANPIWAAIAGGGDFSSNTSSSVDSEVVLFSSTGGKTGKRATGTGLAYLTSGVLSVSKVVLTQPATAATITVLDNKTVTFNNTITFAGTDGTTMTFPSTTATIARIDSANTFVGASTASAWVLTSPTITTKISPTSDDGAPLGDTTHNFSDLFLATGAVINFANSNVTITHSSALLTFSSAISLGTSNAFTTGTIELGAASDTTIARSGAGAITVEGVQVVLVNTSPTLGTITTTGTIELGNASDTTLSRSAGGVLAVEGVVIPSISSTNTLTNKYVTPQVQSVADAGGTFTPVSITNNMGVMTALSQATTIAAPTGSPVQGETLLIRIKDNATARALTWNAIYRASSDLALPTTTILSKTLYCLFVYNSTDTKWDLLAYLNNF